MKIGFVLDTPLTLNAGVQKIFIGLASYCKKKNIEYRLIVPTHQENKNHPHTIELGTSITLPLSPTTMPISFHLGTKELKKILEAEKFDIIHLSAPFSPFLGSKVVALCSCPVIATYTTLAANKFSYYILKIGIALMRNSYKKISTYTAVSAPSQDELKNLTKRRSVIIPNGIDYTTPSKIRKQYVKKSFTILFVGRLEKRKGVILLIMAFEKIIKKYQQTNLIICGEGPEQFRLKKYILKRKIPNIEFAGKVTEKSKEHYLASSDICAFPAIYGEAFGIVVIEALAAGKIPICFSNPGYSSTLAYCDLDQLLVKVKDHEELAKKIMYYISNTAEKIRLEQLCKKKSILFDWNRLGDMYMQEYKKIIQHHMNTKENI